MMKAWKLTPTIIIGILNIIIVWFIIGLRCQTILAPSRLHLGENNTILLISDKDSEATLKVVEKGFTQPILSHTIHFRKGQLVEFPLLLEGKVINNDKVTLAVTFENEAKSVEEFELSTTNGFVFFQTDKPIYRVKETVRFRILRLNRSMTPIDERVLLRIKNHQKVKVDEVSLQTQPPLHVAEYSFSFPLIAKPGIWTAELYYGPQTKLKQSVQFEVSQYVLPIFKTVISAPKYILIDDRNIPIGINVTYTYGKPVRGTVHFNYYIAQNIANSENHRFVGSSETFCFDNGTFKHNADISFVSSYAEMAPARFIVEATVKDCASSNIEKTQHQQTYIVRRAHVISLRKTILQYRRNVSNSITFEILNPHGEPVPDLPINLTMTTKIGNKEIKLVPYIVSVDNRNGDKTDKNGQVIIRFHTREGGPIKVNVNTMGKKAQQISDSFTIEPIDSEETEFVWINNKQSLSFTAGNSFQSLIESSANIGKMYLIVISKGAIIHKETIEEKQIVLKLTNKMVPSVRLLLIGFTNSGNKYVADSVRIDVQQGNCGVNISLNPKHQRVYPGKVIDLIIHGEVNDVVGLHAIDEAVYVLRNTKNSSMNAYKRSLEQSDSGCGAGSGSDLHEVIRGSGFKVLSPGSDRMFSDQYCKRTVRKKRNSPFVVNGPERKKFLDSCCELAKRKTKIRRTCDEKSKLVRLHTKDDECARKYYSCCLMSGASERGSAQTFLASVPTTATAVTSTTMNRQISEEVLEGDPNIIRQDFRDTWLFDLLLLNQSETTISQPIPHSITTWIISSFSISKLNGLCWNPEQQIITFKPFFIHVDLPQVIVEREQAEIKVTVFNYLNRHFQVKVVFKRINGICSDWGLQKQVTKVITVHELSSAQVHFPLIPLRTGLFKVQIEASRDSEFMDKVIKNLTVIAPGVEQEQRLTFDLDPLNRARRETVIKNDIFIDETRKSLDGGLQRTQVKLGKNIDIQDVSSQIVPNTLRYVVTAVGERFTPQLGSIEQLSDLIKKPKGCGEQNMYYMSFNLFTLMYLEKIDKLSHPIKEKGIRYLKRALAQELNFRKSDGSFSAFYKRKSSIWLTGFVAKILCQSSRYIDNELDPDVVISALKWLHSYQDKQDGNWREINPILHEKALGGLSGMTQLTAYLTITFHECRNYLERHQMNNSIIDFDGIIKKANSYILRDEAKLLNLEPYSTALIAYALTLNDNDHSIYETRLALVTKLSKSSFKDTKLNQQYWKGDFPVETASYALMAIMKYYSDFNLLDYDYMMIVNWLSAQEKSGTFDNTQDTIVALEALATFYGNYKRIQHDNTHLQTNIMQHLHNTSRLKREIRFDNNNADVLQTIEVNRNAKEIEFETRGNGLGKLDLLIIYNQYNPNVTCHFHLEIEVSEFKVNAPRYLHIDQEIDDDLFATGPLQTAAVALNIQKDYRKIKSRDNGDQIMDKLPNCCSSGRLAKRSIVPNRLRYFWTNLAHNLSSNRTTSLGVTKRSEPKVRQSYQPKLPKLPHLGDNPVVLLLNICVRQRANNPKDMVILEVSMLSGYKPIIVDLEALKKDNGYIEYYELTNAKVTFYFGHVPDARNYCLSFRVHREQPVSNLQSALIRIYSYYNKEWMCTRLYSDIKTTTIDAICQKNRCKCVTNKKCPDNEVFKTLLSNDMKYEYKNRQFHELYCTHSYSMTGTVDTIKRDAKTNVTIMVIKRNKNIHGDFKAFNDDKHVVRMNPECANYAPNIGEQVILMHNPDHEDHIAGWLLDERSIMMRLDDENLKQVTNLISTNKQSDVSCTS